MGDIFDSIASGDIFDSLKPDTPAEAARKRLAARGVNPDVPVDTAANRKGTGFMDTLREVANGSGPNPFEYAISAAKGAVGMIPSLIEQGPVPAASGAIEGGNMARRMVSADMDFPNDPGKRRAMKVAGAVPMLGEAAQNVIKPSLVASERPVTDQERLDAMEGTFALGSLAAGKARGTVPSGGDWAATDPTRGVRQHLSEKTAPQIMRNLAKPTMTQTKLGADPGEFMVGMKAEPNGGVASLKPQIEAKLATLEAQADQIAFNTPEGRSVPIDYEAHIRSAFDRHIQAALDDAKPELATRLGQVMENEIASLHSTARSTSGSVPARVGRPYHQALGKKVRTFTNDPADGTIRAARKDAWEGIKEETSAKVPALAEVNKQIHSGIIADEAVTARAAQEANADPLNLIRHPLDTIAANVSGPAMRSRLASGLRGLHTPDAPPQPAMLPPDASPFNPIRAAANRQPRALPPAPTNAPEGFISSDDLRRVGTRVGQTPDADSTVFAPQNATSGMVGTAAATHPDSFVARAAGEEAGAANLSGMTVKGRAYRGMDEQEFNATVGAGRGIKSTGAFSARGEGTNFATDLADAESYVNFGRTDPRKTGRPTYIVEVDGASGMTVGRDGYLKITEEVPADRITRIIQMNGTPDGRIVATVVGGSERSVAMKTPNADWLTQLRNRAQSPFYDLILSDDLRKVTRNTTATRAGNRLQGGPASAIRDDTAAARAMHEYLQNLMTGGQ